VSRIYRYILASDFRMAPCPADDLITLATCKPVIRRTAQPGDWVMGFRPGTLERGLMLWAGRVAQVMDHGQYEKAYRGRPDAVYRRRLDDSYERLDPTYHPTREAMARDLSGPVLIFDPDNSCYLNGNAVPLPSNLAHLAAAGRGHHISRTSPADVARLKAWVAELKGVAGEPHSRAPEKRRNCD
jgi:hypothetical protein